MIEPNAPSAAIPASRRRSPRPLRLAFLGIGIGLIVAINAVVVAGLYDRGPDRPSATYALMPEVDYASFWAAGRLARNGDAVAVYRPDAFQAEREATFGTPLQRLDWLYPPPMVALAMAWCGLPLFPGFLLWTALILMFSASVLRWAGLSWPVVLFGLLGPPTWRALILGQYAPLAAALVFAGLLRAGRSPARAGLAVAGAVLKPQLGLMVPIAWIARRCWKAFAAATAGVAAIGAMTTLLLGSGVWPAFLAGSGQSGRAILQSTFAHGYPINAASVFWTARAAGAGNGAAYAVQAAAALLAAALVWRAARGGGADETRTAMLATSLTPLVSPYLYASDLVGLSIVLAILIEQRGLSFAMIALWLFPGIAEQATVLTGQPILPLCTAAVAWLAWRRPRGTSAVVDAA